MNAKEKTICVLGTFDTKSQEFGYLIDQIRALTAAMGLTAQLGMAPHPRPGTDRILDPFLDCRRAAVLALFYPDPAGEEEERRDRRI